MCGMAIDKQLGSGTAEQGSTSYVEANPEEGKGDSNHGYQLSPAAHGDRNRSRDGQ